jgi:hypothetical protein
MILDLEKQVGISWHLPITRCLLLIRIWQLSLPHVSSRKFTKKHRSQFNGIVWPGFYRERFSG